MKRFIYACLVLAVALAAVPAFAADVPGVTDEGGSAEAATQPADDDDTVGTDAPTLDYDSD